MRDTNNLMRARLILLRDLSEEASKKNGTCSYEEFKEKQLVAKGWKYQ